MEDEDQSADSSDRRATAARKKAATPAAHNSMVISRSSFASRGKKFSVPKITEPEPLARTSFKPGQHVRHPKYGEGIVYRREGEGS